MRCFFALDLDDADKNKIDQWRRETIQLQGRKVTKDNFHITLVFLGQINDQQQLENIQHQAGLIKVEPFELNLDTLGYWSKPKVLWLGTGYYPKQLSELVSQLSDCAHDNQIAIEKRRYQAHLTLYRKYRPKEEIKNITAHFKLHFDSFKLFESKSTTDGVRYIPIKGWKLGGS